MRGHRLAFAAALQPIAGGQHIFGFTMVESIITVIIVGFLRRIGAAEGRIQI